jgi:hypothetical protein
MEVLKLGHSFVFQAPQLNEPKLGKQLKSLGIRQQEYSRIISDVKESEGTRVIDRTQLNILQRLRQDTSIVITKADKGDTWVVLNSEDYIWECQRQLSDRSTYRVLHNSESNLIATLFRKNLLCLLREKYISITRFEKLVPKINEIRPRAFYILPKIHKPKDSWSVADKIPSGRPIVGNIGSEDTEICKFIDSFLKPIVAKQPYVICNTEQVLHRLEKISINPNSILFTLDVNSLYTNIPIAEGIDTVKRFFDKYPESRRPDEHLLKLLSISLYKNDFCFNGTIFRQVKGVAMGKQYAPSFANLYMCCWEEQVIREFGPGKLSSWMRYLDDIFGVWEGNMTDFILFIQSVNGIDPNIQITSTTSLSDVQFLDLVIFKTSYSKLSTMVYLKPTSSLKLIHPKSLHPRHLKEAVIYSQILRYYRNTQHDVNFRSILRKIKQKVFIYVNYRVTEEGEIVKGFVPCRSKCAICPKYGENRNSVEWDNGVKLISQHITCKSSNLIYIISCRRCNKRYVGETGNSLKQRISQHVSSIKLKYDNPISLHFNSSDHSIDDLSFFGLISNSQWKQQTRRSKEATWIKKLNTFIPNGLNNNISEHVNRYVTVPFIGCHSVPQTLSTILHDNIRTTYNTGTPLRVFFNHKHIIARS